MGSSGEEPNKGIDATAGGLVWVRRRNGSWWPGKILGPDELPDGCVPTPRSGTPVKLLGREDASVDWYNLEKSKRVKAFHCEEYDDCIKKVQASASHPSRKAAKYARREDAILHALELENARLGKDHPNLSATADTQDEEHHHVNESLSASNPSEQSEDEDEDLNSSGDDSDSGQEVSQSGVSFDGTDHVDSAKEDSNPEKTPNDSEDDESEGGKRMRGLEDLGMGVASSLKRKRSQAGHVHELLKRKNRHRPLTKVMECATMVSVPVACERLSCPTGSSLQIASDIKFSGVESNESKKNNSVVINNNSDSNGVPCENGTLLNASRHASGASLKHKQKDNEISGVPAVLENGSSQKLFDVPLVAEEKNAAGLCSIISDASQPTQVGAGAQSSQSSHVEAMSMGNEEHESGSTSSGAANVHYLSLRIDKGTSEWQLKGKRNSRSRKVDLDNEAETYVAVVNQESFFAGSSRNVDSNNLGRSLVRDSGGYRVKSRPITGIQVEEFRGWSWNASQREPHIRGSTAEQPVPQRLLPYRQSRFTVNPKYDDSNYSLGHRVAVSGMYDVNVEVKTSYRPQRVPYISLMSKLTGRPIIGHPLAIEVLKDGFCDDVISKSEFYSSSPEFNYNLNGDIFTLQSVGKRRGRGRPPYKHGSSRAQKSSKSRRNGLLSKKTRKLSSLTGSHRLSREETKLVVEKLKGPSIACVPLKIVFSRINAALTSSVRAAPRLNATSSI